MVIGHLGAFEPVCRPMAYQLASLRNYLGTIYAGACAGVDFRSFQETDPLRIGANDVPSNYSL